MKKYLLTTLIVGLFWGIAIAVAAPRHKAMADITPWSYLPVTASGNTVVCNKPCVFGEIINESTSAQPAATCTWFDNASTNSGNILYTENGIGAGQIITFGMGNGIQAANGITVNCSLAPSGALNTVFH